MGPSSCHWSFGEGVPLGATADAPAPVAAPLEPGACVGEAYRIVSVLGAGASGVVYRVEQRGAGRHVALKLLAGGCDPAVRERLLREGEIMAGLDHPGIGRVFGAGEHEGLPFLVFELLEDCRPLEEVFGGLERERAVEVVLEVAEALAYAHERGVVHRDVKPENILLDADARPRVIDFGLARAEPHERLTQTGALLGTPLYMAPECWEDGRAAGPQADVWALGVLLYRGLSGGAFPFEAHSLAEQARRVAAGLVPPLPADVDPDLERVCRRALDVGVRRRYPDAGAFADDLGRALASEPLAPGARARALAVAGLAAAAGVGLLAWAGSTRRAPAESPAAAVREDPPPAGLAQHEAGVEEALEVKDFLAATRHANRVPAGPHRARLLARIAVWRGEPDSALSILEQALIDWPESSVPALALLDHFLEGGEVDRARRFAARPRSRRGTPELETYLLALRELHRAAPPIDALKRLSPERRLQLARWLAGRGERDLELLEFFATSESWVRVRDPGTAAGHWLMPLRLSPTDRRARAVARLSAALAVAPDQGPRRRWRGGWYRGVRDRAVKSATRLGFTPSPRREQACAVLVKAAGRSGAREPNPLGRPRAEYLAEARKLDPTSWPTIYFQARERFNAGEPKALLDVLRAVDGCPRLMRHLHFDLKVWSSHQKSIGKPGLAALITRFTEGAGPERVLRAVLGAAAVEYESLPATEIKARYLDAFFCRGNYPTSYAARLAHAFLALRTGRLTRARDELEFLIEAYRLAPTAEFYRALLLMREGAAAGPVLAALKRAKAQGFEAWDGDRRGVHPEHYPEVKPYVRLPAFRGYFRLPD